MLDNNLSKYSEQLFEEGCAEYNAGRNEAAQQKFEQAVRANPGNANALNALSQLQRVIRHSNASFGQ